jgi:phosphatidylethanolamine-binding protein (PEBP) family uncharacterized protein
VRTPGRTQVKYAEGKWGRRREIKGSSSSYVLGSKADELVGFGEAPKIEWTAGHDSPEAVPRKFVLLMLDLDDPQRNLDGSQPGSKGPTVHWFALNCLESSTSCHQLITYQAPHPVEHSGEHRFVFLLFEQLRPPPSAELLDRYLFRGRSRFDLGGFLREMDGCIEPRALNFFYLANDGPGAAEGAVRPRRRSSRGKGRGRKGEGAPRPWPRPGDRANGNTGSSHDEL